MISFTTKQPTGRHKISGEKDCKHSETPTHQKHPVYPAIPYTLQDSSEGSFFPVACAPDSYLPVQTKAADRAYNTKPTASMSTVSFDHDLDQWTHHAVIQRRITVDACDNSKPPAIKCDTKRNFTDSTKQLYRGASIAYVVPFSTIQNFMKAILESAVTLPDNSDRSLPGYLFYINPEKQYDMRRLVKSIIPSAGYQFDFHEQANLAHRIQEQQEIAMGYTKNLFPPYNGLLPNTTAKNTQDNANDLLNILNNSFANLRTGYQNTNELIQDHLDPIGPSVDGSALAKVRGLDQNAPTSPSFRTNPNASIPEAQIGINGANAGINELSLAKRMHKPGRLKMSYSGIEVYGILHTKDNQKSKVHSFHSSEADIGTRPKEFLNTHSATPAHTKTAHIKGRDLKKYEYESCLRGVFHY